MEKLEAIKHEKIVRKIEAKTEELKKYTISTVFPNEEILNDALNKRDGMEEDIKRISNLIDYIKNADYVDLNEFFSCEDIQAIENILAELEPIRKLGIPSKTLVAEFERLENIEDKWVQKIKAKIEELNKEYDEEYNENYYGTKQPNKMPMLSKTIQVLEELQGE